MSRTEYRKAYYAKHRERLKAASRAYYAANKEACDKRNSDWSKRNSEHLRIYNKCRRLIKGAQIRATWRAWRKRNAEHVNFSKRRNRYGITKEQCLTLLEAQGVCCAICGVQFVGNEFHVDHDHEADIIRGLLCRHCNHGLGSFKDNAGALRRAAEYLETSVQYAMRERRAA